MSVQSADDKCHFLGTILPENTTISADHKPSHQRDGQQLHGQLAAKVGLGSRKRFIPDRMARQSCPKSLNIGFDGWGVYLRKGSTFFVKVSGKM